MDRVGVFEMVPACFLSKAWKCSQESYTSVCSDVQAMAQVLMQNNTQKWKVVWRILIFAHAQLQSCKVAARQETNETNKRGLGTENNAGPVDQQTFFCGTEALSRVVRS